MELIDIPLFYFLSAFVAWLMSFVWFVRHPEWIGGSVLVFMFAMPVVVDNLLGGTYIPTGQIIVLFFCPALFVSVMLRQVHISWGDLILLGGYGLTILMSIVANDLSLWGHKAAIVPLLFAFVIYLSVDSKKALYRVLYVYIALILINTAVAGLQRAGFDWAYLVGQERATAGGFDRGFGLASSFTMASLYATMVVPIGVTLFLRSRKPTTWVMSFVFTLVGIAGQAFSVSRSGVLGTVLGVFVVIKRGVTSRAVVVGMTLALIGTVIVTTTPLLRQSTEDLMTHLSAFTSEERELDESAASRPEWAMLAVNEWLKRPILGGGPHAVKRNRSRDPHNTFVNVLASYGIIGFTLFIMILFRCYRHTLRAARMGYGTEGAALAGAFVSTLPIAFFHSLDYVDLFWFMPALCMAVARLPNRRQVPAMPPVVYPETGYALQR